MKTSKKLIAFVVISCVIIIGYLFTPFCDSGEPFDEKKMETWYDTTPNVVMRPTFFDMLRIKEGMLLEDAIKILGKPQEQWGYGEAYLVWDTKYVLKYTIRVATAEIVNEEGIGEMRLVVGSALLVPESQKP